MKASKVINSIFIVFLVFNTSGFFRFFSASIGVSIAVFTLISLIYNLFYLLYSYNDLRFFVRKRLIIGLMVLLYVWPLLTIPFSKGVGHTDVARVLYFFSLFISTVIFFHQVDIKKINAVFQYSLIVTIFGGVLSIIAPKLFLPTIQTLGENEWLWTHRRAFGFEIQANRLACNSIMLFLVWFSLKKWNSNSVKISIVFILFFSYLLLTGSRTGMGLFFVLISIIIIFTLKRNDGFRLRFSNYIIMSLISILMIFSFISIVVSLYPNSSLSKRLISISNMSKKEVVLVNTDANSSIQSALNDRFNKQFVYIKKIGEKPLGYGFNGDKKYLEEGTIKMTAHSEILTTTFQFGILYPILLIYFISRFLNGRKKIETLLNTNLYLQFFVLFIMLYIFAQGTLISRSFIVMLSFIVYFYYFPTKIKELPNECR